MGEKNSSTMHDALRALAFAEQARQSVADATVATPRASAIERGD